MKKIMLALSISVIPTIWSHATDTNNLTVTGRVITQRMDVSTMGKVVSIGFVDGSSQTTAGFMRFKDEGTYFMSGSTIDCVGAGITCSDAGGGVTQIQVTATGGGGGGGGGGAIYDGATTTAMSTFTVAGAKFLYSGGITTITVLFQGVLASSHTGPNFWSSTQAGAAFFSIALTTAANRIAELSIATGTLLNMISSNAVVLAGVPASTAALATSIYLTINSTWTNLGSSTQAIQNFVSAFTSTSDARGNTFVNFRSTSDTLFSTLNSTVQAIVRSTTSLEIKMATATLIYNAGISLTAIAQGANITLTQSGSTLTIAGSAGGAGITQDQANVITVSTWNALASFQITAGFDGSGAALTISSSSLKTSSYAGTITSFTITAPDVVPGSGEVRVRIAKAPSYGTGQTATWTDICTAQCPSLSNGMQRVVDSTLGGWTTAIVANDNFRFSLDSAAVSIQNLTVEINVKR